MLLLMRRVRARVRVRVRRCRARGERGRDNGYRATVGVRERLYSKTLVCRPLLTFLALH